MGLRLGLDIGANSIGWAIVDTHNQKVISMGSRVFPAGVNDYDTNKEATKNQTRREARGLRRQYVRRRWRKIKLLEFLIEHNLTPFTKSDLNVWKKKRDQPNFEHLTDWFANNPYGLREKALSEKIELHELGRILYHIIQRRGFLSNRKSESSEESTIFQGRKDSGTIGISDTRASLSQFRTLGEYLSQVDTRKERIRNRYTSRAMYVDEAKQILKVQKEYHSFITDGFVDKLIGSDTKKNMNGVLFFQRPLKSQKHTLGRCVFEPGKTRCPVSRPEFEEFRVWSFVNTIEYQGEKIPLSKREQLADYLLSQSSDKKFKDAKKHLKYPLLDDRFNYSDDDKLPTAEVSAGLRKAFGTSIWENFDSQRKLQIWHDLYAATDNEWLKSRLNNYDLSEKDIEILLKTKIKRDYGSLSLKAIHNILPFLKQGFIYNEAVLLAGVVNAFGDKWDSIDDKQTIVDTISGFKGSSTDGTVIDQIKHYLSQQYGLTDSDLRKLYHHSQTDHSEEKLDRLPEPQKLRNPIVLQAIYEVRSLVNLLLELHGSFDSIHIELARDLKKNQDERSKIKKKQTENQKLNEQASEMLAEYGVDDTYFNRLKVKLFNELREKKCPYTGKTIHIGFSNGNGIGLFTGEVQVEHIVPYNRSLNNSFGNLTLCDANENRAKGDKTPYEYYSSLGNWEGVKQQSKDILPYFKYVHFKKKEVEADIASRLLNDTRYMSREVHKYLKQISDAVVVVTGSLTADLRHHWGLNSILSEDDKKDRSDHRHHAIDALVVALTDRSAVLRMSRWNKFNKVESDRQVLPPWEDFRQQAQLAVNQILVSHKKVNRFVTERTVKTKKGKRVLKNLGRSARGQLHKETVFGKRLSPETGEYAFHVRKSLNGGITKRKQIEKVVDPVVRGLLYNCLDELGIKSDTIPNGTFVYAGEDGNLHTRIKIQTKSGDLIPVYKVRVKENLDKAVEVKDDSGQFVNPRNNHHVALYVDDSGNMVEDCVTFWDVVERKRQGLPAISQSYGDNYCLMTTLQANDMFLIGWNGDPELINTKPVSELVHYLYRVQKLSSMYYVFRHHRTSTLDDVPGNYERIVSFKAWKERNPIKVWVTTDGRIELYKT
jgi:CRISPR-associated endonuclease Csn1